MPAMIGFLENLIDSGIDPFLVSLKAVTCIEYVLSHGREIGGIQGSHESLEDMGDVTGEPDMTVGLQMEMI